MDLLLSNSNGSDSDTQGKNGAMGLLSANSVQSDLDIDYKFVPSGDQMAESKWFHMMKTALKSTSKMEVGSSLASLALNHYYVYSPKWPIKPPQKRW